MGINIGARLLVFRWYSPVTKEKLADPRVMHTYVSSYLEGICIPLQRCVFFLVRIHPAEGPVPGVRPSMAVKPRATSCGLSLLTRQGWRRPSSNRAWRSSCHSRRHGYYHVPSETFVLVMHKKLWLYSRPLYDRPFRCSWCG